MTWSGSGTRSNSHPVAGRSGCTNLPRAAGGAQEGETILDVGLFKPSSAAVRPPGSAGADQAPVDWGRGSAPCSGLLEDGSLNQHAGRRILPERNQQLARQSNNHRLAETAARALDPL